MLDSVPIGAWYAASVAAAALLAYRVYSRRADEQARRAFAERRNLAAAGASQFSGHADSIIPWAIQQARDSDQPFSTDRLTREEARLAELAQAAITLDDRAFKAACRNVPDSERMILEYIRRMAGEDSSITLDHVAPGEPPMDGVAPLQTDVAPVAVAGSLLEAHPARLKPVAEIAEWLPANSDSDLWHLLVGHLDFEQEGTLDIVDWIVRQPDCDRATAALTIVRIGGDAYMQMETAEQREQWGHHIQAIVATVCERSEVGLYPISRLNLSCVGQDNDQRELLETLLWRAGELEMHGHVLPWPHPLHLLSAPFEGRDAISLHYEVRGDGLYRRT